MHLRRRSSLADWPCWLLIAAWLMANLPPLLPVYALAWAKGAEHFSHYHELRLNVAALLTGTPRAASERFAGVEKNSRPLPPPVLADNFGKSDWLLDSGVFRMIGSVPIRGWTAVLDAAPVEPVTEVPYPPPRGRGQA